MENYDSTDSSTSGDLSAFCESAADPPDPASGNGEQSTLIDVAICVDDSHNIEDSQKLTCELISSHAEDGTLILVNENSSDDCYGTKVGNASSKKRLDKCATFPSSSKISAGGNMDKDNEETSAASAHGCLPDPATRSCLRSASLPSTLRLVPAMKGTREKLGKSPQKMSVTWAPDVYDPVPTSVSHLPTNKSHRHRSDGKKNGRNKQKGGAKSSRGSSRSKDKKQTRKVVGGSSRCYKTFLDDFPEAPHQSLASMTDFEVGSADASCGSSFLKNSMTQVHFPVAEAT